MCFYKIENRKVFAIQKYIHIEYLSNNIQLPSGLGLSVLVSEYKPVSSFSFVPLYLFSCFYSLIPFTNVKEELMPAPP